MKTTNRIAAIALVCTFQAAIAATDFVPSGRLAVGVNYWGSAAATEMWRKWDAASVEEDLRTLAANGITLLRVFPNWADFQPIVACQTPGASTYETRMFLSEEPLPDTSCGHAGVDERMVERFEAFCDMADKHGIRLIVPLLTGQMTFRVLIPPALAHLDLYADPYALMWEGRYLECLVTRLKAKKAIVAWESGNEARVLASCQHRYQAEFWQRFVHQTIRLADPSRPVIGVDGLNIDERSQWPSSVNAGFSDYVTTHPYGFWGNAYLDDFLGIRSMTFAAAQTLALEQIGGKPAFVEEHGSRRQEQASQRHVAQYVRGMLWNCWAADCRAMLWWCAYDQTGMTIAPYNWRQPCVELGAFRRDRSPYPAAASLRNFAAMQARLPFVALPKARTDAVVLTTDADVAHSAYILARQEGLFPGFASPEKKIPDAPCYFIPSAKGRAGFTIETWEQLKEKIRNGATLYLSWDDTFLDSLEEVCGIEVDYREATGGVDACDFGDFKLDVAYAVKRRFRAIGAETLATNAQGEGVFFRKDYGKGRVYTFIHPVERLFYAKAGQYRTNACRIYGKVCPKPNRLLVTGEQDVIVSEHFFADGDCGVIVVNNRDVAYEGRPQVANGWAVANAITDDAEATAWSDGKLTLAPNAGILLLMKR